jgi:DNA-binding NarL/FixJ family response regulator
MKILIVEDSEQMRSLIKSLVKGQAREVIECSDGAKALAAYVRHRPECVLMDIKMRDVDGITATRQIVAGFPDARVIIVTDYNDADLREAAREAGASGYLLKEDLLALPEMLAALK